MTLPRSPLATLPTPFVRARGLERALAAGPVFIKRDDLTGFGIAGNKARALEFLLGAAVAENADILVAAGSQSSNFCAAAAIAARVAGLECDVLFAGPPPTTVPVPTSVALARAAGARLRFLARVPREALDEAVLSHADTLRTCGRRPYAVPRGGATAIGAVGYVMAAEEMAEQSTAAGVDPRVVVVATGSGGTQAGLVAGQVGFDLPWRVVGASVSRPADVTRSRVLSLSRACAEQLGLPAPEPSDVEVHDLRGPGFGLPSPEDRESADIALRAEGILLDHHYGSKAMTLLRRLLRTGVPGPMVFLHTGGVADALAALTEGAVL
ncbi:MAG TPA: pyridoxal-phosphate dependent enzyme [Nocardioidaceae bacterium]|nr:pyridoxal-phosphate dependent enzyme [Nocardioidaceae bacterium]